MTKKRYKINTTEPCIQEIMQNGNTHIYEIRPIQDNDRPISLKETVDQLNQYEDTLNTILETLYLRGYKGMNEIEAIIKK